MNCKPGDLAILVRSKNPDHVGRLVDVLRSGEDYEDGVQYWSCKVHGSPVLVPIYGPQNRHSGRYVATAEVDIPDAWLRPIRDHGDDAVDESKAWLPPVPLPTIDPSLLPEKVGA